MVSTGEEPGESQGPLLDVYLGDCAPPSLISCDEDTSDPLHVLGLDCLGGIPTTGAINAPPGALGIHAGPLGPYEVREGSQFLILSTGIANHLPLAGTELEAVCGDDLEFCPSTQHEQGPLLELPAPMTVDPVDDGVTCIEDPNLVGHGDCSNTLYEQLTACGGLCKIEDYAEIRLHLTVPAQVYGLAFDFAFMSTEWWEEFAPAGFNDMFVAWLESDSWTGNASFDNEGNPITVNSSFRDYTALDLAGFAMEGHAGTRWLTTDFGVTPGETIELVLAVFDVSDDQYDSVVLLDGFRWTCTGTPPTTTPVP